MPRRGKNSDSEDYFTERARETRLERLRKELIKDYGKTTYNKRGKSSSDKKRSR